MKSGIITVRIKENDMPIVRKAARMAGLSISSYVRSCTMEDFRTACHMGQRADKMLDAFERLLSRKAKEKEMGAGSHPVPPTIGATGTPPTTKRGRKVRESGTT